MTNYAFLLFVFLFPSKPQAFEMKVSVDKEFTVKAGEFIKATSAISLGVISGVIAYKCLSVNESHVKNHKIFVIPLIPIMFAARLLCYLFPLNNYLKYFDVSSAVIFYGILSWEMFKYGTKKLFGIFKKRDIVKMSMLPKKYTKK